MLENKWLEHLNGLKDCHSKINDIINGATVCYLDIPFHFNVGDLLIYKGTEQFLEENSINVKYRSFANNCNFKEVERCEIILLHGGGNFGDIYDLHQKFRERIIRKFPNKKIICLPQSIHFTESKEMEKSARVFKKHPDLYLLVRDKESFSVAPLFTNKCLLIPDMAHSLHPLVDKSEIEISAFPKKRLKLNRIDIEKVESLSLLNKCSFDWNKLISRYDIYSYKLLGKIKKIAPKYCMSEWSALTDEVVFRSINYFAFFEEVQTDRLHGFILSYLLGKQVFLFDNSYGKNQRYYSAWFSIDNPLIKVRVNVNVN